jgi:hypothetical protein
LHIAFCGPEVGVFDAEQGGERSDLRALPTGRQAIGRAAEELTDARCKIYICFENLEPLAIERTVYCLACGYAGTLDLYARVKGVLTVLDWKSGKAIYPEAFLQNLAYRHAATRAGLPSAQGLIVRLPKRLDDPAWEVMSAPTTLTLEDFLAALRLWRWQRAMNGQPTGDRRMGRASQCAVPCPTA